MQIAVSLAELKNKKKARLIAIIFLTMLIVLLLFPLLSYQDPPPGQEGITVNLGIPDVGQGEENAPPPTSQDPVEEDNEQPVEEEVEEVEEEVVEEPVEEEVEEEPVKPEPTPQKEVVQTEDPEAIAIKKRKERERLQQEAEERAEKEAKRKAAEAKKRAEEAAKRKAEKEAAEKAKYNETKNKYSGLFGGGDGSGKGNTGKPGNQGDPNGDPNADALVGISTGSGRVGGGLGGRGITNSPKVRDNSQKTGTIVLKICVGSDGRVIGTPEYTQRGSTTSDSQLRAVAIRNAKKWTFQKGSVDKQCGTITYDFKVQ